MTTSIGVVLIIGLGLLIGSPVGTILLAVLVWAAIGAMVDARNYLRVTGRRR